jgi:preflagellin peptidase FlaK
VDAFAATRLAAGTAFLVVAAASDLRTRRVRDPLWIGLGTLGLVVLASQLLVESAPWPAWSFAGSAALLFYAVFFGRPLTEEDGFHARPIRIVLFFVAGVMWIAPFAVTGGVPATGSTPALASTPVMIVVYQGLYRLRVLHGGADAKGLMAITLLVPTYPDALPFPLLMPDPRVDSVLRIVFPFSLVVWVDAAIVSLAIPIGLFIFNALRGDFAIPQAFIGYRARLDSFPNHAWLMEKITPRGEHVLVLFPKRGENPADDIARLRAAGVDRAWVTPKTPFMLPLLIGFVLAFLAGNLLLAVLGLGR